MKNLQINYIYINTVTGTWSEWSFVGESRCSATCGSQVLTRVRECIPSTATCEGDSTITAFCDTFRPCPGIISFSNYSYSFLFSEVAPDPLIDNIF